jgi:hypothetical protein
MDVLGWFQVIPLIGAFGGVLFELMHDRSSEQDSKKTAIRILTLAAIGAAIVGAIYGRQQARRDQIRSEENLTQQRENQKKQLEMSQKIQSSQEQQIAKADKIAEEQQKVIEGQDAELGLSAELRNVQSKSIQQITRFSLDRNLSGLEISYKPSADQWKQIARIYHGLRPREKEPSYYDAPIIAERTVDGWSVIFGWAEVIEGKKDMGQKMFLPVFASDKDDKGFASLIKEACIPLLIKWSDGTETDIEPWNRHYPPVITISHDVIAFTLRPPFLNLYLEALREDPKIILRTRANYLKELKFRCLDGNAKCNETIQLHWKRDDSTEPQDKVKPFTDVLRLHPTFRTASN